MTTTKKLVADEIVEAMVEQLCSASFKELFHKTAAMPPVSPCTFCGKGGHAEKDCPEAKKPKDEQKADTHECPGAEACDVCKKAGETKEDTLKTLAAVADALDKRGFAELANILDESIEKVALGPEWFAAKREEEVKEEAKAEARGEELEFTGEPDIDEAKAKALGVLDAMGVVLREEDPDLERMEELQQELEAANATLKMLKERGMPR